MADAPTLAEQIAVVSDFVGRMPPGHPDLEPLRAVLATLEAQPARDAVIEAARYYKWASDGDTGSERLIPAARRALHDALAALPPERLSKGAPDKEKGL